jgi:transcription elongation factor SPT6
MYIWTHKKHEVTCEKKNDYDKQEKGEYDLKLADLWFIWDLDLEWMQIHQKKKHIDALMEKLSDFMQVGSMLKNTLRATFDLNILGYYLNYVEFHLRKYMDDQDIYAINMKENPDYQTKEPQFKRMKKRNFAREVIKHNLHEVAYQICLPPDHLAENLVNNELRFRPKIINENPDKIANEFFNPAISMISTPVQTLTTLCEYVAMELFYQPLIRKYMKKMYNDRVTIHTNPTEKGEKEITVYNFYYPVKRIRGKKPSEISKELWLMIMEAEQKGLVKASFQLPWDKDDKKDEKKDEIRRKLLDYYTLDTKNRKMEEGESTNSVNAWNIVREESITKYLKNYIYPSLEQSLRDELKEISEKYVISECAKYFKETINILPYKKTSETGEKENEQSRLKVLSCISEAATSRCYFVVVDENGELMEHLVLDHIGRNPGDDFSLKTIYNQEREELKALMFRIYPDVIVVGAANLNCQQIKLELDTIAKDVLVELNEKIPNCTASTPFVMWGINSVPTAWAKTYQARKKYGELPQEIREALSVARIVQDPLAESLNLWNERIKDNALLYLNYHVMQHMVNPTKLKNEFEKIAMEVCSNVGVDINRIIRHRHLASTLQFVPGMGPRKAAHLIEKIQHELGALRFRRELFESFIAKTVYINTIGFIKIYEDANLITDEGIGQNDILDTTRIHPDFYLIAVKVARDTFDDQTGDSKVDYIRKAMENPKKLQELDLEDYAKHLNQRGKNNMMSLLEFIVHEFNHPFQDPRTEFKTKLRQEELFYKLTKESKYTLREESIITVRITRIDSKAVRVVTDSGVPGIIPVLDLKDKNPDIKDNEIGKYYSVGEYLRSKVRSINFNLVRLKLSTKNEDLLNHRDFMKKNKILESFDLNEQNFQIDKDNDYPIFATDKFKKQSRYIPRRINHPKFKNISLTTAQEYLQDREIGDFVIRPSSKGMDHLNITWKLSSDNIVHLDIKDGIKGPNDLISKHLKLDNETYESLDEIIERYIKPCNNIVAMIRDHKKFMDEPVEFVKNSLIEEKKNDQSFIPYNMSFIPRAPQYLVLSYIPRHFECQHEYIKIKPEGLMFHNLKFTSIKKLIQWFKDKLKTNEYQKYLEHLPPLPFDVNLDKRKIKEEYSVKKEVRDPKRERKREKDSVYKRPADSVKRRRPQDGEVESKYGGKSNVGWNREGWDGDADWEGNYPREKGKRWVNCSEEGRKREPVSQQVAGEEEQEGAEPREEVGGVEALLHFGVPAQRLGHHQPERRRLGEHRGRQPRQLGRQE